MTIAVGFFAPSGGIVAPTSNAIDAWFTGGGLGIYYYADPLYCFTDTAGTTHAAVGDSIARVNDRGGSGFYISNATVSQQPVLRLDTTIGRYYLEFSSGNVQRLNAVASSVASDWRWLHDGTEYQCVVMAQYGKSSNPNALMTLWSTNSLSSVTVGACMTFDDRASVPNSNAQRHQISKASGSALIDLTVQNAITPNTRIVVSQSYANGVTGNDCVLRAAGAVTGGAESSGTPATGDPQGRFALGTLSNATLGFDGRVYALAILRGSGARTNVASYEAVI